MEQIKKNDLIQWLDRNVETKKVIAPREIGGVLLYRRISNCDQIVWDFIRPTLSIKEAFFPPTESLLKIKINGQDIVLGDVQIDKEQVLFGIRPCDARGVAAMDAVFIDQDPADSNYANRRDKSIIIGLACKEMGDTCFCTSTGGSPDDPTGMDLLLKETGDSFEVQAVNEKGLKFANEEWNLEIEAISDIVGGDLATTQHHQEFPIPELSAWPPQFGNSFWEEMAERCLSCKICAYVCPTCRCFDIRDESIPSDNGNAEFERIRCWDSCAGESYRKIAGGHNPREEKGQRLRNRFFCKFYYYPEQYGPMGCTGCGRCIDSCPVNIDITEVISYINEQIPSF